MPSNIKSARSRRSFEYDVCLSFARENRGYVRRVAEILRSRGTRVFFDEYEQVSMWGKDLYSHLDDVYQNAGRYCVIFVSRHYARKLWTNHERESAQARAIRQNAEYILPARFDTTRIPGLRTTVGYINLRKTTPAQLAQLIIQKVGARQTQNYFPPVPDRLFTRLKACSAKTRDVADSRARGIFETLSRMSPDERMVVLTVFLSGCPTDLPDNMHINLDLLRRLTGFPPGKLLRLLGGLRSLGLYARLRRERENGDDHLGETKMVEVEWENLSADDDVGGNVTDFALDMFDAATDGYCAECGAKRLHRLDFSQLSSATRSTDKHIDRVQNSEN